MEKRKHTWILASNSPRRKELLGNITEFTVLSAEADESVEPGLSPDQIVEELAARKAQAVFERLSDSESVIGADTIVYHKGEVLGKPKDKEDAFRMLKSLSGDTHSVFTGVCVLTPEGKLVFHSETKVTFDELPDEEIREYIDTGEPMDKAGAYGIQGLGGKFVTGIEGDYTNVVGFPVGEFCRLIRNGKIIL